MTPQDHNRFLGIAHLIYGGFYLLLAIGFSLFFFVMFKSIPTGPRGGPPAFFFVFMATFFFFFYAVMTCPSLIAGYALLKKKRWARTAAIIGGVMAAMQFPIGTAVCVYTFWFIFSEPGRTLYDKPAQQLPPAPPVWTNTHASESQREYMPRTPPDWR